MAFDIWLENRTPFEAATHVQLDADGQEILVILVSASFIAPGLDHRLDIATDQVPVIFADVPFGDPARSSNRYEADIAPLKPLTEILVIGTAYAPNGKPATEVDVGVRAGDIRKILKVTGDVVLTTGLAGKRRPFIKMPIRWERAYGGTTDEGDCDVRNPVGIGYRGARSADPEVVTEVPNVAYASEQRSIPTPAGFGPIGRGWQPRLPLAGTYDQSWLDTQWPLPPRDFNPRYNMCAPLDQQSERLGSGSIVTLVNLTPTGQWQFRVPSITAPMQLIFDDRIEERSVEPDTIIVEPDLKRLTLKARLAEQIVCNRPKLREIVIGHVSPVWLNARLKRKEYLNLKRGDGTLSARPVWTP
jgi:hypothetical protein